MFESFRRRTGEKRDQLSGQDLIKDNLPGIDTYDDGQNEFGETVAPGSTSLEAGGTYMEDKGPQDMRRRDLSGQKEFEVLDPEVTIQDSPDPYSDKEFKGDNADKWLRENDPNYGKY